MLKKYFYFILACTVYAMHGAASSSSSSAQEPVCQGVPAALVRIQNFQKGEGFSLLSKAVQNLVAEDRAKALTKIRSILRLPVTMSSPEYKIKTYMMLEELLNGAKTIREKRALLALLDDCEEIIGDLISADRLRECGDDIQNEYMFRLARKRYCESLYVDAQERVGLRYVAAECLDLLRRDAAVTGSLRDDVERLFSLVSHALPQPLEGVQEQTDAPVHLAALSPASNGPQNIIAPCAWKWRMRKIDRTKRFASTPSAFEQGIPIADDADLMRRTSVKRAQPSENFHAQVLPPETTKSQRTK